MEIVRTEIITLEKNCRHCGGIMRYYLGSWSCMMCGRDINHDCPNCACAHNDAAARPAVLLNTA